MSPYEEKQLSNCDIIQPGAGTSMDQQSPIKAVKSNSLDTHLQ